MEFSTPVSYTHLDVYKRQVINKNVTEEEIERTCKIAFEGGCSSVKLYFMIGLPTETDEDIKGIADTAQKIVDIYYSLPNKPKGKGVNLSLIHI